MPRFQKIALALTLILSPVAFPVTGSAQIIGESGALIPTYADVAPLAIAAPLVIDGTVRNASRITGVEAAGVAPGSARFYVELNVTALIRGSAASGARIAYVADLPLDASGRAPRLRNQRVLIFARAVAGRPGEVQLITRDGQWMWSPELDQITRRIVAEAVAPDAPPAVTGVSNAFFVPGTIPGEGETQIFLTTVDNRPISLTILRKSDGSRSWTVSLSEIVEQAAPPPSRDTLLWYRLACALPPELPVESLDPVDPVASDALRADYRFVLDALGKCNGRAG